MKSPLTCEVVRDLLPSYIDGLTSPQTAEQVRAHLDECAACRAVYGEMTGEEPPRAEQPEIDYLKKVRASGRRLQRIALLAGCAVLVLGAAAVLISKNYKDQAAADEQTITALKESEQTLQRQMELPTARYAQDTRVLVVTGTDRYDQLAFPPGAEKARTLDVQDDEFHLSVYVPLLKNGEESLRTYLPAYIDRTDKSLAFIRAYLREHAPDVYPAEIAGKMAEISIREDNRYSYRNEEDRVFLNLRDYYWHRDALYLLALMDTESVGWAQLGYAYYVETCLDPYSELARITEAASDLPYYDIGVRAGMRTTELTCSDFRTLCDAVSRVCLDRGLTGWGSPYESYPLNKTLFCTGPAKAEAENGSMSVFMAAAFMGWLGDAYGFEAISAFSFGQKTFEEAFGTDFAAAFSAWKAWIVETYPLQ